MKMAKTTRINRRFQSQQVDAQGGIKSVCAREFSYRIIRGIQDKLRLATLDICANLHELTLVIA